MMRTCIKTEVTPIVGSEQQSEDLVLYLLKEFEENPAQIWESNIFGKSLHELVNEACTASSTACRRTRAARCARRSSASSTTAATA